MDQIRYDYLCPQGIFAGFLGRYSFSMNAQGWVQKPEIVRINSVLFFADALSSIFLDANLFINKFTVPLELVIDVQLGQCPIFVNDGHNAVMSLKSQVLIDVQISHTQEFEIFELRYEVQELFINLVCIAVSTIFRVMRILQFVIKSITHLL